MFTPERRDKDHIMWKTQYDLQIYIWYKFALTVCTRHKLCRATEFVSSANCLVQISGYKTGYGHQVCVCTSLVCVIRTVPLNY
jgi:hypothetical protein